ncbi:V-type proton ATPase proteolipid subunit [Tolypocladium paradoxum]|uniref:V-type proton ATPase proteolipid subunit n=1 Tax=Tolypocladium paradoxum TaxID=94208 RepID=A0A2S4LA14_9HYPO|nr:V-type proton ATPase proteolipid subunit [Tolypocladium paradoxum]
MTPVATWHQLPSSSLDLRRLRSTSNSKLHQVANIDSPLLFLLRRQPPSAHDGFRACSQVRPLLWDAIGAAYGTAKSGIGIAGVGTFRPDLIMKVMLEIHTPTKPTSSNAASSA